MASTIKKIADQNTEKRAHKIHHPAKFTDRFLPIFAKILKDCKNVVDPFAGTGKLALIKDHGFQGKVICNELEVDWTTLDPHQVDEWHYGDAATMTWCPSNSVDAICTSPCYGNRMADHHNARDGSRRITYTHCLGHPLHLENTGRMQWGEPYRQKHIAVYQECYRILTLNGLFIVNISNHIRKGQEVDVVGWNKSVISGLGFQLVEERKVETPRMKRGENYNLRVQYESILIFRKKE
jgi:hypothetical protein